ncbi:alpha/beta hydrolase fold domain-containing protein [Sarocladium implicatum]|nr:alpha/beta hydrolase fold domain-containing protein [Sarocladium implicatum]
MDFSEYGAPTEEWLTFVKANPDAAQDGFTNNDTKDAAELRAKSNKARGATGAKLIAASGLEDKVAISTVQIPSKGSHTIPLRIYKPKTGPAPEGAVLYFHGGGYLLGDETSDDYVCCQIASETQVVVLSVIYRHTDEHKHPAQTDDAWDAFQYIRDNAETLEPAVKRHLGVLGISAGCTLAASVVLREIEQARTEPGYERLIKGAVLGIPWLIHIDNYPFGLFKSPEASAKIQNKETPVIPSKRLQLFSDLLGAQDPKERLLNIPLLSDEELQDWPKTAFLVAGADPLRDDGLVFAKKLEAIGVPTNVHIYPGLPHGFRRWAQLESTTHFDATLKSSIGWIRSNDGGEPWRVFGAA